MNAITVAPTQQVPPPVVQAMAPGNNAHGNPVADSSPPQPAPGNRPPTEQGLPASTPQRASTRSEWQSNPGYKPSKGSRSSTRNRSAFSQDRKTCSCRRSPRYPRQQPSAITTTRDHNWNRDVPCHNLPYCGYCSLYTRPKLHHHNLKQSHSPPPRRIQHRYRRQHAYNPAPAAVLNVGSNRVTANKAGAFVFAGQTAAPGAPAITVSGTTISIQAQASSVVINGVMSAITHNSSPVILDGQTFSLGIASGYIFYSTPLIAGCAPITVSGTPYSLATGATALVVGSRTQLFTPSAAPNVIASVYNIWPEFLAWLRNDSVRHRTIPGSRRYGVRRRGKHANSHPFTNPLSTGLDVRRIDTY